jgi:hypothetical protein
MVEKDSNQFNEIAAQASPEVEALARSARALILGVMPDAVELVWPRQNISSYGVGPKKMSEHFCYIAIFKAHINLGFYYGAELDDRAGMLEGTGALMRHIKVKSPEQLDDPSLRTLVEEASTYLPKLK